jgi:hypothetical protein
MSKKNAQETNMYGYMCSGVAFYAKYFMRIRVYEVGFEKINENRTPKRHTQ